MYKAGCHQEENVTPERALAAWRTHNNHQIPSVLYISLFDSTVQVLERWMDGWMDESIVSFWNRSWVLGQL